MDLLAGQEGGDAGPGPADPEGGPLRPLPYRMRPQSLAEFVGQERILGEGKLLRRLIQADRLFSLVFWGPPGTGKTALAEVLARTTSASFREVNATTSNVQELRGIIAEARRRRRGEGRRTVLFVDEIHRFNRAQQDVLLPDVEKGNLILIGATTHNPFFAVNAPLLSRSQLFAFEPLGEADLRLLLERALKDAERGLGKYRVEAEPAALAHLLGDTIGNLLDMALVQVGCRSGDGGSGEGSVRV